MHLEQQIKDFVDTFPNCKQTHRNMEKLTWSPSTSYYPFVAPAEASNPTLISKLVHASINTKKQRHCNIHMDIHFNQLNQ